MDYKEYTMEIVMYEDRDVVRAVSGFDEGDSPWSIRPDRSDS